MSAEIMPHTVTYYNCPVCHTGYTDINEAKRCAGRVTELEQQISDFQLWSWYRLVNSYGHKVMILPYKVEKYEMSCIKDCMHKWHMHIHDSQESYYYSDAHWQIIEGPLKIAEAWDRYKVCPNYKNTLQKKPPLVTLTELEILQKQIIFNINAELDKMAESKMKEILRMLVFDTVTSGKTRPYVNVEETIFYPTMDKEFSIQ